MVKAPTDLVLSSGFNLLVCFISKMETKLTGQGRDMCFWQVVDSSYFLWRTGWQVFSSIFLFQGLSEISLEAANDTNNSAFTVSSLKCQVPENTVILRKCMFHTNSNFLSLSFQTTPARLIICEMSQFGLKAASGFSFCKKINRVRGKCQDEDDFGITC